LREAVATYRRLGPLKGANAVSALNCLARALLLERRQVDEAERLLREALALMPTVEHGDDPVVVAVPLNLADALLQQNNIGDDGRVALEQATVAARKGGGTVGERARVLVLGKTIRWHLLNRRPAEAAAAAAKLDGLACKDALNYADKAREFAHGLSLLARTLS